MLELFGVLQMETWVYWKHMWVKSVQKICNPSALVHLLLWEELQSKSSEVFCWMTYDFLPFTRSVVGPSLGGFLGDTETYFPGIVKKYPWIRDVYKNIDSFLMNRDLSSFPD